MLSTCRWCFAVLSLLLLGMPTAAVEIRVLQDGESIGDNRLGPLKDLNGYFPFRASADPDQWAARAARRRTAVKVALGLWPMPTKTPLNAVVHGQRDMGDYTIDKVYFESFPGYFVTGNLYRPKGFTGPRPAVLSPHGHFRDGRFGDQGRDQVLNEIVAGAERFEEGGRNQIQARCVQLARMGCLAFSFDMIGYCDSVQLSLELAHGFSRQRPEMNGPSDWGLFSPQAESMLQSVMGLQTWNSIRALDWICSLPDVDVSRIAVTGASGGGTQTFILGAIDDRPSVLVPAVMVSTAMQGGCTCENASLLRVGTGNVEIAALIAPRPMCLISANDWTHEMSTKGFPELLQHYEMLGAGDRIAHYPFLHFGHNYNYVSRSAMYQFLNQYLDLHLAEPVVEQDYERLSRDELTVWDADHPRPESGLDVERDVLRTWAADTQKQLRAVHPRNADSLAAYRQIVVPALDAILGRTFPLSGSREFDRRESIEYERFWLVRGLLRNRPEDPNVTESTATEVLPIAFCVPRDWAESSVVIWLHENGKDGLFVDGKPLREVQRLLDANIAVIGVDLMEQGELSSGTEKLVETRCVDNPRESAAYTLGYNDSLFAQRVHDVLSVIGFAIENPRSPENIWLVGLGGAGPWAAAARAQAGEHIDRAAIDTGGFRFINVNSIGDAQLLPGGAKYDDLPGMLAVAAPHELWLAGEDITSAQLVADAYQAAGAVGNLHWAGDTENAAESAVSWLLGIE